MQCAQSIIGSTELMRDGEGVGLEAYQGEAVVVF